MRRALAAWATGLALVLTMGARTGAASPDMTISVHFVPGYSGSKPYTESVTVGSEQVYKALIALPAYPRRVMYCPEDNNATYRLQFFIRGRLLMGATVRATGCQKVILTARDGRQKAVWATVGKPSGRRFWRLLDAAIRRGKVVPPGPARA